MDVPKDYVAEDGFKLKTWLKTQITRCRKGECTDEQIKLLQQFGVCFETLMFDEIWDRNYIAA
ncbi:MAG: helicase associated domain-containing protein [Oscillospiraceae bacterium]|nr:helicase associated domain-containing protein [Oscillospiraceae bacterium]